MRVISAVLFSLIACFGLAFAQSTSPPTSPPPSTQPPPGGVGVRVDLDSFFGARETPCDRIRQQIEKLRTKIAKNDCSKQEAAVEAARHDVAQIIDEIGEERARRDALHAEARATQARHNQAQAALRAAQAAAVRADEAAASARDNLRTFLQNHWGNGPEWFPLEAPAEPGWRAIEVEPGITVYMEDGDYWTPNRLEIARSRLRQVIGGSAAGRTARNALQLALQNQAAAQQALAEAEAAAAAAGDAYFDADQAVHGLPPIDAKLKPAERRLEKALAALERCREKQVERLQQIAELEETLRECDRIELLADRLEIATEAGENRIDAADEEISDLETQLREFERNTRERTRGADSDTRAAKDRAKDAAKDIRDNIDRMTADMEDWRDFAEDVAAGDTGVEGQTDEMAVDVVENGAERFEDYINRIRDLFGDLREAERDWTGARNRADENSRRKEKSQTQWEDARESFEGLADETTTDTAKSMLGEASEKLNIIFAMADAINHVADMSNDQRALLRAFGHFLNAVLSARGDIKLCYASGEQFAIEVAQLTNSDVIVGGTAALHLGMQYCEVFMESARDPEMRKMMIRVKNAALAA